MVAPWLLARTDPAIRACQKRPTRRRIRGRHPEAGPLPTADTTLPSLDQWSRPYLGGSETGSSVPIPMPLRSVRPAGSQRSCSKTSMAMLIRYRRCLPRMRMAAGLVSLAAPPSPGVGLPAESAGAQRPIRASTSRYEIGHSWAGCPGWANPPALRRRAPRRGAGARDGRSTRRPPPPRTCPRSAARERAPVADGKS